MDTPKASQTSDANAFGNTLVAISVVVALLWGLQGMGYSVSADTAFLALIGVAVLAFALTSGRISEFSVGDIKAKLRDVGQAKPIGVAIKDVSESLQSYQKQSVKELTALLPKLSEKEAIAFQVQLQGPNTTGAYEVMALQAYAKAFLAASATSYMVVVDADGSFIGAVEALRFVNLDYEAISDFADMANASNHIALKRARFLNHASVSEELDNRQALETMRELNVDFLVVVDTGNKPKKIVLRRMIVEQLLLALTA